MLTLTALEEGDGLRIRTSVVTPAVWKLPLPGGEQLELVLVPGGDYGIGSPQTEQGRDWYANQRDGCKDVNVEAKRTLRLEPFAMARHAITQAQWRAVAELPQVEKELKPTPGTYRPDGLWETHAQPGALPVDSVSWNDCQEWLQRLNRWLTSEWSFQGGKGEPPELALPGEGQWEAACRAGTATPFHFGDVLDAAWANSDGGYPYGPSRKGLYRQRPMPVGFFGLVNRWGLAEMHGQLFDWCGDSWHPNPTGEGWPRDGQAWQGVDPALEALGTAQKQRRKRSCAAAPGSTLHATAAPPSGSASTRATSTPSAVCVRAVPLPQACFLTLEPFCPWPWGCWFGPGCSGCWMLAEAPQAPRLLLSTPCNPPAAVNCRSFRRRWI